MKTFITLLATVAFTIAPVLAVAQTAQQPAAPQCGLRNDFVKNLTEKGAEPVFAGKTDKGGLIEIWTDGDNWVAFMSSPDGKACPLGAGDGTKTRKFECINLRKCPEA